MVQTKEAIVVALFFAYIVYTVAMVGKYLISVIKPGLNQYQDKFAKLQHDIVGKSFFFFYLLTICSQVSPNVFVALLCYAYLISLGVQTVGALFMDNDAMRKFRAIGLLAVCILVFILFWTIVINDWCNMFYFSQFFSLRYANDQK